MKDIVNNLLKKTNLKLMLYYVVFHFIVKGFWQLYISNKRKHFSYKVGYSLRLYNNSIVV